MGHITQIRVYKIISSILVAIIVALVIPAFLESSTEQEQVDVEEVEILTNEQLQELETESLPQPQEDLELEKAQLELQAYFAEQARQKEDRERLDFETKMLMIEKGVPLDGSRYSSKIRTDSEGNTYYSDSDGNYVKCRTDSKGTTYCTEQ